MLLALLACAASGNLNAAGDGAPMEGDGDTGTGGSTSDSGTPVYWTLAASLDVVAGVPRTGESSLVSIELLDSSSNPICATTLPVKAAVTKTSPDEAIYAWWLLTIDNDGTCDPGLDSVLLGIGEMNADVEAASAGGGYDAAVASSSLNGAYFGADAKTRWAFGVAGLAPSFDGDGEELDGPPIPDGTWLLEPLFPFPL